MTTQDFICYSVLGIPCQFIDELCEEYDVDFSDDDVKDCLNCCCGSLFNQDNFRNVGNMLIQQIFQEIINKYNDVLDEDKFDWYIDGRDSKLSYDGETIYSRQDIERLSDKAMEVAA